MNIELKPCPFCGGEAVTEFDSDWGMVVRCARDCGAMTVERRYPLAIDPIEAWNTRAERTCRMDYVGYIGTEESHASIYQCSKCSMRYMSANVPDSGEYCMACGAKVVEG